MMKQKRRLQKHAALALPLMLSFFCLLAGCREGKKLLFCLLETGSPYALTVDGVRYIADTDVVRTQGHSSQLWLFSGEIGSATGICGGDNPEKGGGYDVCQIKGDDEHRFLYVRPNHFVFGPYNTYFFVREDLPLERPSAETVSSVTVVYDDRENTSIQADSPAMTAALLEAYSSGSACPSNGGNWLYGTLIMHHKDFSFLQCEIEFRYSPEQETACCESQSHQWTPLSAEWSAFLAEHGVPAGSK